MQRKRDPADERQVIVHLTEAGRRLREKGLSMNLVKEPACRRKTFGNCRRASSRCATTSPRSRKASGREAQHYLNAGSTKIAMLASSARP